MKDKTYYIKNINGVEIMKRKLVFLAVLLTSVSLMGCGKENSTVADNVNASYQVEELESNEVIDDSIEVDSEFEESNDISEQPERTNVVNDRLVELNVICEKNIVFSKYDVKVIIDNNELGTIEHGKEKSFNISLSDGKHTVEFINVKDESIFGTSDLEIKADVTIVYNIECKKDKVSVTLTSRNEKSKENQISIPFSSSEFKYKQLDEVQDALRTAGFTNIKTEKIEDLIIGFLTSENEVESVIVNNVGDYAKGDIFDKDVEVIISYHTFPDEEKSDEPSITESSVIEPLSTESSENVVNSEYELAFVRKGREYNSYYMFDTDKQTVISFATNDTSVMSASYTGDFETGVDMNWESYSEGWHDKFVYTGGTKGVWYDYTNNDYDFIKCDVTEAQEALNKIRQSN